MAAIDIGAGTGDYDTYRGFGYTGIDLTNPANDDGVLDTFKIWLHSSTTGFLVGTFYGSGTSYTVRDYETLGSISNGSEQTFTGKSCDVQTGDFIGGYNSIAEGGQLECNSSGGSGTYYVSKNGFDGSAHTYTLYANAKYALYGTGETAAAGWTTAKLGGIASASIIKVAGIAVASVKKVAGVAVQ